MNLNFKYFIAIGLYSTSMNIVGKTLNMLHNNIVTQSGAIRNCVRASISSQEMLYISCKISIEVLKLLTQIDSYQNTDK